MKIENSTILITGASSGIGKVTAIAAVEGGARVVLLARFGTWYFLAILKLLRKSLSNKVSNKDEKTVGLFFYR